MKLSCQEHLVPGDTLKSKLHWLKQNQFDGIELWAFDLKSRIPSIKEAFSQYKAVQISALCGGYDGNLMDLHSESRNTAMIGVKQLIWMAAEIGAPGIILVPSFGTSNALGVLGTPYQLQREEVISFAETLSELSEEAEKNHVRLFLEPINRYESFCFNQVKEVAEVCNMVSSPYLSILIDSFHMNIEEDSIKRTIKQYDSLIGYVHLADSNRLVPGYGHVDFPELFRTLQTVGYDGFVTLECFIRNSQEIIDARDLVRKWISPQISAPLKV
ncbi:sugar phosphate isomerase/epimerase family protein [Ammoniphilus resinae]|uniref:Sugar phosphate isomerase/epimerase n=1 Tax=Ammoniphilus resinae TaxID=861532 RepID=A0ABS4GKZ6_9BACL|nr:sugar phosphate isomerase/epimerase family protein [Ammoniphilus resinae]MBP1930932.1 sugar phosphate isomerase/epimerase [Ammoniphilus resinae]